MWNRMKEWLLTGCIPDSDTKLELDLTGLGFHINRQNQLVIESKQDIMKRGVASSDDADALALTFARPVEPESITRHT
jgi:phage terminase large subunit